MEALCTESLDGLLADVLEQEETKILIVYGVEGLGLADRIDDRVFADGKMIMDAGGGGGDGSSDSMLGSGDGDGCRHS